MVEAVRRVVLVGFMTAGKSTVGRLLAERLGWRFVDFDPEIERRAGKPIHAIFEDEGEAEFRRHEARLTAELAGSASVVLAPGGGWVTQRELVDRLRPGSIMIWLRVGRDEALRRARADATVRPLLAGADPAAAERLLEERERHYARADWTVDVDDRVPADVAEHLSERLREAGVEGRRAV